MHSSVSPCLQLFPSIMFLSISSYWFLFIFFAFLLNFSLCSFVLSPSSMSMFLLRLCTLYLCFISCFFPQVFFSCSFVWNKLLCFISLCNFLCLCESSYLFLSWTGVLVWEHSSADCVCPVTFVAELDEEWAWITSSPGVWCSVITLLGGGTGDGETEARTGYEFGSSYSQWLPPSSKEWKKVPRCWSRSLEG